MGTVSKVAWAAGGGLAVYFCVSIVAMATHRPSRRSDPVQSVNAVTSALPFDLAPGPPSDAPPATAAPSVAVADPGAKRTVSDGASGATDRLTAALDAKFNEDQMATQDSIRRESAIRGLFSQAALEGQGALQDLTCRATVCRGTVRISNPQADQLVFGTTLLSAEFSRTIRDAVSVPSRHRDRDGSIVATFYIHPQNVFDAFRRSEAADDSLPGQ